MKRTGDSGGCTDTGDVSHIMPVLHPYMTGARGTGHGADYAIADPKMAYVEPAKQLALMAVDLLWGDADGARDILKSWTPRMTKEAYLAFQRSISKTELYQAKE